MKKSLLILAGLAVLHTSTAFGACVDHTILDNVLKANVNKDGYVDYDGIRINRGGDLYEYIAIIEDVSIRACPEIDRSTFWVNAYNAHLIRLILARPELKQVTDDPALFDERFKLARMDMTLNMIFHRILRQDPVKGGGVPELSAAQFDPRIHFILSQGAIDSPKLSNRAYQPQTFEASLQNAALAFANNPKNIRVEAGILKANELLKNYGGDFSKLGGVPAVLIPLTDTALRKDAHQVDDALKADFPDKTEFSFNGALNSVRNRPATAPK